MHASRYPFYVLALLWAAALLRFVDLQIIAVLLEPIKAEFKLDDTSLALLGGAAFALFYGVLGIPVAWLAERSNRRTLIAVSVSLWSLMTMLCGQATSFSMLLLARMGVGIGEAGAYPPTTSLLADYFLPARRGRACAVIASAIPIGVLAGFAVGGLVAAHYGWRTALQVAGLPGVILGLLIMLTLKEPRRSEPSSTASDAGFIASTRQLWQQPGYRSLVAAACLFTLGASGSGLWLPSFYIRRHGFSGAETGLWMALLYGAGGLLGSLLGGWLAQHHDRDGSGRAYAQLCQWSLLATVPLLPLLLLSPSPALALCCHAGITILMHMNVGPVLTLIQQLAGPGRRALAHAWSLLVSNVIALPLGPLAVGWLSDRLTPAVGNTALGYCILVVLLTSWPLAAWMFMRMAQILGKAGNREGGGIVIPAEPGSGGSGRQLRQPLRVS